MRATIFRSSRGVSRSDWRLRALDRAQPTLQWRVARDGICLLDRTGRAWNRFRIAAAIEHADMKHTMDRALAAEHRRLLAGARR